MTSELRDPEKPAGFVVEVDAKTGVATRNDGVKLKPAEKNPWYVLMTIAWEQDGDNVDWDMAARNRRYWNGWACGEMDQAARTELEEKLKLEPGDLDPLIQEERGEIAAAFRDRLAMPEAADDSDLAAVTRLLMKADESGAELPVAESFIDLREIHFSNTVVLEKWIFSGPAFFSSATFSGVVDFSNEGFGGTTSFAGVRFTGAVPKFYGREFHQDTDIPISPGNWPDINAKGAGEAKRAYTRLRQVMNGLHKPDAEAFFGRQELRCDAFDGGQLNRWMNWGYGFVSEYGHSVGRPIAWLASVIGLGWALLGSQMTDGLGPQTVPAIFRGLALSFSNTFAFFGFQRLYFNPDDLRALPSWVQVFGAAQTVAGFVLLFFLGLGLRNRFRLK